MQLLAVRTARKLNAVVNVCSQNPLDFDANEDMRGIRSNCEFMVVFPMDSSIAEKGLGLSSGEVKALRSLRDGGKDFRELLYIYPSPGLTRGCARLRVRFSDFEARLALGAEADG